MPSLPKPKQKKRIRRPTGKQAFYASKRWGTVTNLYRINRPLCEACLDIDCYEDVTPGGYKGVTDHVIRLIDGGAETDERNLMALGGTGSKCRHHARKSALENAGAFDDIPFELNKYGEKIPTPAGRQKVIDILNEKPGREWVQS